MERINNLKSVEKEQVLAIAKKAVQKFYKETQKIGLGKSSEQKKNERIAAVQKPIKKFAKDMLKKASIIVNYSKNPDFINK
jgi:hypothetical protein